MARQSEVTVVELIGVDTCVVVKADAGNVTVRTSPQTHATVGEGVGLEIQAARVSWFDAGIGEGCSGFRFCGLTSSFFLSRRPCQHLLSCQLTVGCDKFMISKTYLGSALSCHLTGRSANYNVVKML
jgi:hypothetical protein